MTKKKKDIKRPAKYRIRFDQFIDGKYIYDKDTKADAMHLIRENLRRYPYAKATLKTLKTNKKGYKNKSSWMFRRNKKTGRHRLVKL